MRFGALLLGILLACMGMAAHAEEYLKSFKADIDITDSGMVTVTETIDIVAEGVLFKHGIYRDVVLPPAFAGSPQSKFVLVAVERDGHTELFHTADIEDGRRIYVGNKDQLLSHGNHRFRLTYATDNRIDELGTNDMFSWIVNGTCNVKTDHIEANVTLPEGAQVVATMQKVGPSNGKTNLVRAETTGRTTHFVARLPLARCEWMSIKLLMPRGIIARNTTN